ncbi:cuticle protein CP14.6-like [Anopheles cruzii]|uniref:cuticle protein CP14.6-like n=1 Tax=Anopheles cruzii TaxID=68878 RepID=UPI0022EC63CC|nr:cuticle protein CP14.6-like [Anopheles cruzii]
MMTQTVSVPVLLLVGGLLAVGAAPPKKAARAAGGGGPDSAAVVVQQDQLINDDGSYSYVYETSNGIRVQASSADGVRSSGDFSYTAPDGTNVAVMYVADEYGFQAQGEHLPVEPPAPDHVIKLLEDIRDNPPNDPDFDAAFLDSEIVRLRATQG